MKDTQMIEGMSDIRKTVSVALLDLDVGSLPCSPTDAAHWAITAHKL